MLERKTVILMADDDADDRLLVREAFDGRPVELRFVEDGQELMDYLYCRGKYADGAASAPRPDLILLDLNMPRKDGRQALREIQEDTVLRVIPVVILTTSQEECEIYKCYALGANSYIIKPVSFQRLVEVLDFIHAYWFSISKVPPRRLPKSCEEALAG